MISAARLIANSFINVHAVPVARIHPRINLVRCYLCNGNGRSIVRYQGRVHESDCANCNARGTIVTDEA